jgi:hypothetical protein
MKPILDLSLFNNSIGTIRSKTFVLHDLGKDEIEIDRVVFMELKKEQEFLFNKVCGFAAFICLMTGLVLFWNPMLSVVGLLLLFIALFKKNFSYCLKVTYRALDVSFVDIRKDKVSAAEEFIDHFYKYQRLLTK